MIKHTVKEPSEVKSPVLGGCVGCMREVLETDFHSVIARREYDISKLCQRCQKGIMP